MARARPAAHGPLRPVASNGRNWADVCTTAATGRAAAYQSANSGDERLGFEARVVSPFATAFNLVRHPSRVHYFPRARALAPGPLE